MCKCFDDRSVGNHAVAAGTDQAVEFAAERSQIVDHAADLPWTRNQGVTSSAPESLGAIDQRFCENGGLKLPACSRQSEKTSTQFLHRSKTAYFYQLYQ
jgi:hypothetical protein